MIKDSTVHVQIMHTAMTVRSNRTSPATSSYAHYLDRMYDPMSDVMVVRRTGSSYIISNRNRSPRKSNRRLAIDFVGLRNG